MITKNCQIKRKQYQFVGSMTISELTGKVDMKLTSGGKTAIMEFDHGMKQRAITLILMVVMQVSAKRSLLPRLFKMAGN